MSTRSSVDHHCAHESINITLQEISRDFELMLCVDLTRSNGDPRARGSLHAFDASARIGVSNEYVSVISSLLDRFQNSRIRTNHFPAYGFGAKLPPSRNKVSHCFALNGDYFNPFVEGKAGVLRRYREVLGTVSLHGPTKFSEVLKVGAGWAEFYRTLSKYLLIIIVTDGAMEDTQDTIDVLVSMGRLPVSLLIVGVGDADFSLMEKLDGDKQPLVSSVTSEKLERDFVQFVRYRDYHELGEQAFLTACVDELPDQLSKFLASEASRLEENYRASEPKFLSDKRTELLVSIHNQGYEEEIAETIIDETGVFCPDPMHTLDVMFHLKRRSNANWSPPSGDRKDRDKASLSARFGVEDRLSSLKTDTSKPIQGTDDIPVTTAGACRVCFTNRIDVSFKPCGHEIVCSDCSTKIGKTCPLCRATIEGTSRLAGQ